MYYTVKTLLERGKSQREIAQELGIHRRTVRKIKAALEGGGVIGPLPIAKHRKLDPYREEISDRSDYQSARNIPRKPCNKPFQTRNTRSK